MLLLTLARETIKPPAAIGRLSIDGISYSDTLERPWKDNQTGISCIPPGRYPVTLEPSPRFGRPMMRLGNTGHRRGILIHAANEVTQLQGCIALGKRHGPSGLIESRKAVDGLDFHVREAIANGESVYLEIHDPKGTK